MKLNEMITIENPKPNSTRQRSKLVLTAGVHGNEIGTILILNTIAQMLSEATTGVHSEYWDAIKFDTIQIIPCVNLSGMQHNCRNISNECDSADLNRCWNPPITNRADIQNVIDSILIPDKKDESIIFVDMHCSNIIEPMFLINADQPTAGRIAHWGDSNGIKVVIRDGPTDTLKMRYDGGDIVALTWEQEGMSGSTHIGPDYISQCVCYWLTTIIPALHELQNIKPSDEYDMAIDEHRQKLITANRTGLWMPFVQNGSYVEKDAVLGYITDMNGIMYPVYNNMISGDCSIIMTARYVNEHEYLCFISKHIEPSYTKHD